jgi:hypothetical protein
MVMLVITATLIPTNQSHLSLRKLHLVLLTVPLQVLKQVVSMDLVYLLQLHVALLETARIYRQRHTAREGNRCESEHLFGDGEVEVGSLGDLPVSGGEGGRSGGEETVCEVEVVPQPSKHLQSVAFTH